MAFFKYTHHVVIGVLLGVAAIVYAEHRIWSMRQQDDPPTSMSSFPYKGKNPLQLYHGDPPFRERLRKGGDLIGNIAADRRLTVRDRDYLLVLSQYVIDKRNPWWSRQSAARYLGTFGHRLAIPALLATLRDEDEKRDIRLRCAQALSMIRDPRVVDYLIDDVLGKDFDTTFMQDILFDLAQFVGGPKELKTNSNISGFKYPPENEQELKRYLQTWKQWWDKNRDNKTMNTKYRGSF